MHINFPVVGPGRNVKVALQFTITDGLPHEILVCELPQLDVSENLCHLSSSS